MEIFVVLALIAMLASVVAGIWWFHFSNKFVVEPAQRERVVIFETLNGAMKVLEPGTHFFPKNWKVLARVDLNREPMRVPPPDSPAPEEFRTADGIVGVMFYRFDIVAGRSFDPNTGLLLHPDPDDVDNGVDPETVLLAVTRIDYETHEQRVLEFVEAANEAELGNYSAQQLFRPFEVQGGVTVPAHLDQVLAAAGILQEVVTTVAALNHKLSQCIEARANRSLTFVGLNIVGYTINNLKPKSEELQSSYEQPERARRGAEAAQIVIQQAEQADGISFREALVANDPAALGEVAQAEAQRAVAQAYSAAGTQAAQSIAEGLRHFGRGQ